MYCLAIRTFVEYTYITTPILLVVTPATVGTLSRTWLQDREPRNDTFVSTACLRHRVAQGTFEDVGASCLVYSGLEFQVWGRLWGHELQYLIAHRCNLFLTHIARLRQRNLVQLRYISVLETVIINLIGVLFFNRVHNVKELLLKDETPVGLFEFLSELASFIECCVHINIIDIS